MVTKEESEKIIEDFQKCMNNDDMDSAMTLLSRYEASPMEDDFKIWLYDNLGFLNYFKGNPEVALEYCDMVISMNPRHAYAHKGRGVCLSALNRVDEGIQSLLKAISLEPSFFDPYHDLAVVLLNAGRKKEAKKWAQRAYQLDPEQGKELVRIFYQ